MTKDIGAEGPWMVDSDNHYYEAEDAFFRHGDADVKAYVRWVNAGRRRHIMFGTTMATNLPNPTFDPVAKPGVFHDRLIELESGSANRALSRMAKQRYGELEPISSAYRDREARLRVMDEQGVDRCLLFPTLGVGVEGMMRRDVDIAYKVFHAFNLWLEEDWGFAYQNRIYAAPLIPLLDPELAAREVDHVLSRGARLIALRPGPANGRSPADPAWDPFWARINEAGVPVAYHASAGPDDYDLAFKQLWERQDIADLQYQNTLAAALRDSRGILDTVLALILGNLFGRFPNVRIASVELGCAWVPYCLHVLDHAGTLLDRNIVAFGSAVSDRPSDIFKERVSISPFPEEDVRALIELLGTNQVLFGSDWPHPEGTKTPSDYLACLDGCSPDVIQRVMRTNALELLGAA
jgi:predicted TIM-barrel fold metal-dependent hydrolase